MAELEADGVDTSFFVVSFYIYSSFCLFIMLAYCFQSWQGIISSVLCVFQNFLTDCLSWFLRSPRKAIRHSPMSSLTTKRERPLLHHFLSISKQLLSLIHKFLEFADLIRVSMLRIEKGDTVGLLEVCWS